MALPPLVAIVGPTAVGKSAVALHLAGRLQGEIVSADSRQVYRGMDIGTAKPTPAERARVPHHLLDVVNPDQVLTLAEYQALAYAAIADVHRRGRLPLLVGGSGLYVRAVTEGLLIPRVPPNTALRSELEAEAKREGAAALHERLRQLDPVAAARIDARNVRRVIRALEVCLTTGGTASERQVRQPPPYRILKLGLTRPRPILYRRIDRRIDEMLDAGLVAEVRDLMARGYALNLPALTGVGYRQIGEHLLGHCTLNEAVAAIRKATRRFVRQQANWFRREDPGIRWYDMEETPVTAIEDEVQKWLGAEKV
ncbi:MAG: tRNA (adenosine(37)-N6)-dimethylallyltransferase MiaA [Anaerolineae bacterium]|nr:tRNA (adenosine(37)-N6)-dimethylallyltransferase MiaA [Anaerolineae bacterium]